MPGGPDKKAVLEAIRLALAQEIAILTASANAAREGATHEDAKPENDKDTRAVEAGYLAGAQAKRVRELETTAARLKFLEIRDFGPREAIALGALVEVAGAPHPWYFLSSAGGGLKIVVGATTVHVLTPEAPLGQAFLGKRAGEAVELRVGREIREYEVVGVR